jgi:hypothetical protein
VPVAEGHCEVPRVKFYKFYFFLSFTLYLAPARPALQDRRTDRRTNGHREGLQNWPRRLPVQNAGQTDGRTDEQTQRGVVESASQITGAECRVRQTHALREFIYKTNGYP